MGAVLATPLRANGMFIASSAPKVPFAQKQGAHKSGKSGTGRGEQRSGTSAYKNTLLDPGRVFSYCGA
ncbi:hypothetical protein RQCS_00120 [Rhodococcus qingshengii]|nr:hypothetical protein RQCS_00120 [Rhodococcus qingshengii]